jgi:hypothetical protein
MKRADVVRVVAALTTILEANRKSW